MLTDLVDGCGHFLTETVQYHLQDMYPDKVCTTRSLNLETMKYNTLYNAFNHPITMTTNHGVMQK